MSPKRTKSTKRLSGEARYADLGLRRNPFSGQIIPSERPSIEPYGPMLNKIDQFMTAFLANRASRGMVFIGDYGTGKTYHLKWMRNKFDQMEGVRTIYLETPGIEPYDLVRGVLNEIGEEQIAKGLWNMLRPFIVEDVKEVGSTQFLARYASDIEVKGRKSTSKTHSPSRSPELFGDGYFGDLRDEDLLDHRLFLQAFDRKGHLSREKLRDYYLKKLFGTKAPAVTNNVAVARELASICFYDGAPALQSWERLVIPGTGNTSAFPPQGEPGFLQAIVRVLVHSGVEYLVLFLDEFEKVPLLQTMTEKEAKRYLDTIRMLIDRSWHELPFGWVLGSNNDAWGLATRENAALSSRIDQVVLPRANTVGLARYIISKFLEPARTGPVANELDPFPQDLLEITPLPLRRTPRDLVRLCDNIIEAAARKKVKSPIPDRVVKDVVDDMSIASDVD